MLHQQNLLKIFIQTSKVEFLHQALARLKVSSKDSTRQTLVDLLAKTWEDVLSRAAATRTDFVKTAAEYGTTLQSKDTKAEMTQKFKLSYSDFLSELLRAQEVNENYFSQMNDNPTKGGVRLSCSRRRTSLF